VAEFIEEIETTSEEEITPSLENVIRDAFKALLSDTHVCMPAIVLKYDHKKQLADVQPVFKKKYRDGTIVDRPKIFNVPVVHPRAGNAIVHMPIKAGDSVMLVFSDRSMDRWQSNGGYIEPKEKRQHHISDAIAYPGLYPNPEAIDIANNDDITIINGNDTSGKVEVRIKDNGHFQIKNQTQEFVKVIDDLITIIRQARVYTSSGAQPLRHTNFAKIQQRLRTFKET